MNLKLVIFLVLFSSALRAQDTLTLIKTTNNKEFKIPLCAYSVKVKLHGHNKFWGIITGWDDSTIIFRTGKNTRANRRAKKKVYANAMDTALTLNLSNIGFDSLSDVALKKANLAYYTIEKKVGFSEIKKINIANIYRPEKQKLLKNLTTGLVVSMGVFIASIISQNVYIYLGANVAVLTYCVVTIVLDTTRLKTKGWKIKKKQA